MGRLDLDGTWWAIVQGIADGRRGTPTPSSWSGPWPATTSTSRCWPPTRGRPACCWSTATAASGSSSSATPRTSTRRGAATASTPASATRSTSAGSWPPSCRAGRRSRCSTATSPSAVRWRSGPSPRPAGRRPSWRRPSRPTSSTPTARPARRCAPRSPAPCRSRTRSSTASGLVLGYDYPDSPVVVPDGAPRAEQPVTTFEPSAAPRRPAAARLAARRHVGLRPARRRASPCSGSGLDADADAAQSQAAARLGIPLRVLDLVHLPRLRTLYEADLRPRPPRPARRLARRRASRTPSRPAPPVVGAPTARTSPPPLPSPLEEIAR